MPATILWATLIAWLLLVGVSVTELVRDRKARRSGKEPPVRLRSRAAAFLAHLGRD